MVIKNKKRCLSIAMQEKLLKIYFPESKTITYMGIRLKWKGYLQPTPFSNLYKVRITYTLGRTPKVYVIEPKKLAMPEGATKLEHVWNHEKQQLCLFYPDGIQWNRSKLLAQTIVPWASEWLYFYEIWPETGSWKGGGTHPKNDEKLIK